MSRVNQKIESRQRILEAAGRRLRSEGIGGAGVASVMADAGLTHGAFYSHFADKQELTREALVHALHGNRTRWIGRPRDESWASRLGRLASRYLTPAHRRQLDDSCALAALSSEAARCDDEFRQVYENELLKTLSGVCDGDFGDADDRRADEALAFISLVIGALTLSRAVRSKSLADRLLAAGRAAAERLSRMDS